jgi:hypothetical protein
MDISHFRPFAFHFFLLSKYNGSAAQKSKYNREISGALRAAFELNRQHRKVVEARVLSYRTQARSLNFNQ